MVCAYTIVIMLCWQPPNPALHPTAKRLRRSVPVALRAPAAGEGWCSAQMTTVGASSHGQSVGAITLGVAPVVKILNSALLDALKRIAKVLGLTPTELLD